MTDRILPEPDIFATCPNDDLILSYYEGVFENVYVLLHPFSKLKAPRKKLFGDVDDWIKKDIIKNYEPISWGEILKLSGLSKLSEIDLGLRTSISGLKKEFSDELSCKKLCELDEEIIHPGEGQLSPLLENRLLKALKDIGYDWVWIGDEFGTERKLWWVEDLLEVEEVPYAGSIFTPDKEVLITTHWDTHSSFLCSSKAKIEKLLSLDSFEGFYCSPETKVYWGFNKI